MLPPTEIPWVVRYHRARAAGDMRPFPEQRYALDDPPQLPTSDRKAWVQPDEYLAEPSQTMLDLDAILG